MSFRTEEKIILPRSQYNYLRSILLSKGANKLYSKRKVVSLYFDTNNIQMFIDSEEGIVPRKKLRIRNYPNNDKQIYQIETKISSVEGRYKTSKKILNKEFLEFIKFGISDNQYGICFPQIYVSYTREYFLLNKERVTIDSNISYKNFKNQIEKNDQENIICELKASINFDKIFFDNILSFDRKRFSKYCEGIKILSIDNEYNSFKDF